MITHYKKPFLESVVKLLVSSNIPEEHAYSILVKLWFPIFRKEHIKFDENNEISVEDILKSSNEPWVEVLHDFEYFKVSKIKLHHDIFIEVKDFLENIHINILMFVMKDDQTLKREGHFYSPYWVVESITDQIKNDFPQPIKYSVVDFAAGLGYFFRTLLAVNHSLNYAVELDPHTFEAMLFGFLMGSEASDYQKMKLILTVKQGDALLGYREELPNQILEDPENKALLIDYVNLRNTVLERETKDIVKRIKNCFKLRKKISDLNQHFAEFNWFIDFPELFIDAEGKSLAKPGVDYVIGNPPWINYADIDKSKYAKVFDIPKFSNLLQGKFNFYLPFAILAHELSKKKGGLVLPQTLFTEAYAQKFREFLFQNQTPYQIILYGAKGFRNVINEFCTLNWDKTKKSEKLELIYSKKSKDTGYYSRHRSISEIDYNYICSPFYRLPLFPPNLLKEITDKTRSWKSLNQFITTRRGFTLTRKYQKEYKNIAADSNQYQVKKLIKNSVFSEVVKKGIFNFQVFYAGDQFVYDKSLLGAPADEGIFEQPKIIRRNRGRKWFIGLDYGEDLYVNDIFDIIYTSDDQIPLKALFGYLCSSFIQLLAEGFLQRDITSNIVRDLPIPDFRTDDLKHLELIVDRWISSMKTLEDFELLRLDVDSLLSDICDFSNDLIRLLNIDIKINWKEL
ncbi:MAG: Eco57I restriction-modification methylase domain-containing protein [Candidatus Heimdallarchaeaceae archaeon]